MNKGKQLEDAVGYALSLKDGPPPLHPANQDRLLMAEEIISLRAALLMIHNISEEGVVDNTPKAILASIRERAGAALHLS